MIASWMIIAVSLWNSLIIIPREHNLQRKLMLLRRNMMISIAGVVTTVIGLIWLFWGPGIQKLL